MECHDVQIGR